jgi:hypothetical protein
VAPEYLLKEAKGNGTKEAARVAYSRTSSSVPANFRSFWAGLDGVGDVRVF